MVARHNGAPTPIPNQNLLARAETALREGDFFPLRLNSTHAQAVEDRAGGS